jgi:hypothetical protein
VRAPAWHHLRSGAQPYLAEQLGPETGGGGPETEGPPALEELLPASTLFFGIRGAQVGRGALLRPAAPCCAGRRSSGARSPAVQPCLPS